MTEQIDCIHEDNITCPYCGDRNIDSWEVGTDVNEGDLGKQECDSCGKNFTASRNMSITYDSYKAPCLNGEKEHNWVSLVGVPEEYFKNKYKCSICGEEEKRSQ